MERWPIICGHGLDNDLRYLDMKCPFIIDTALWLRQGDRKMKLKSLSKYFLQEEIQEGQEGHDSGEDARAA